MDTIVLATYLVRDDAGAVDMKETLAKFENDVTEYLVATETETEMIGLAVNEVFEDHKGKSINMPAVVTFALSKLNVQPSNYKLLTAAVMSYVRNNADKPAVKDKKTDAVLVAAEAPRTRAFRIAKGKNGGVTRWADQPEAAAAE